MLIKMRCQTSYLKGSLRYLVKWGVSMYKTFKDKIRDLKKIVDASEVDNNPQIVIVVKQDDNNYKIIETYYNPKINKNKRVEFYTDDYKKVIDNYTSNKTRVIINDLI